MLVWGTHRAASIDSARLVAERLGPGTVQGVDIARSYFGGSGFRFARELLRDAAWAQIILKAGTAAEFAPLASDLEGRRGLTLLLHNPERRLNGPAPAESLAQECERLLEESGAPPGTAIGIAAWNLFDGDEGLALFEAFLRLLRRRTSAPIAIQYPAGLVHLKQIANYHAGRRSIYAIGEPEQVEFCASSPFGGGRIFAILGDDLVRREFQVESVAELSLAVIASVPAISRVAMSSGDPGHLRQAAALLSVRRDPETARAAIERLL